MNFNPWLAVLGILAFLVVAGFLVERYDQVQMHRGDLKCAFQQCPYIEYVDETKN